MQWGDSDRWKRELTVHSVYQHLVRRVTSAPGLPFSSVSLSLPPRSPHPTFSPSLPSLTHRPSFDRAPKCAVRTTHSVLSYLPHKRTTRTVSTDTHTPIKTEKYHWYVTLVVNNLRNRLANVFIALALTYLKCQPPHARAGDLCWHPPGWLNVMFQDEIQPWWKEEDKVSRGQAHTACVRHLNCINDYPSTLHFPCSYL